MSIFPPTKHSIHEKTRRNQPTSPPADRLDNQPTYLRTSNISGTYCVKPHVGLITSELFNTFQTAERPTTQTQLSFLDRARSHTNRSDRCPRTHQAKLKPPAIGSGCRLPAQPLCLFAMRTHPCFINGILRSRYLNVYPQYTDCVEREGDMPL